MDGAAARSDSHERIRLWDGENQPAIIRGATEIIPGLFVGDRDAASSQPPPGVRSVLNITQKCPCFHEAELRYLHIELDDNNNAKIAKYFEAANLFIDAALKAEEGVLVHCKNGMSRSSTLVIAFLISRRGQTLAEAYETVRRARPIILPNAGFFAALQRHEEALQQSLGRPSCATMTLEDYDVERLAHPSVAHDRTRAREVLRERGDFSAALETLREERDSTVWTPSSPTEKLASTSKSCTPMFRLL